MFEAPDGNEIFFEFLDGSSAHHDCIVQWDFLRTNHTPNKKNVAAGFGSRSDARSDHGRSRRSRAILIFAAAATTGH